MPQVKVQAMERTRELDDACTVGSVEAIVFVEEAGPLDSGVVCPDSWSGHAAASSRPSETEVYMAVAALAVVAERSVAAGRAGAIGTAAEEVDARSIAAHGTVRRCWEEWETAASGGMGFDSPAGGEGAGHCTQLPCLNCSWPSAGREELLCAVA
jgi:hypothetical protein